MSRPLTLAERIFLERIRRGEGEDAPSTRWERACERLPLVVIIACFAGAAFLIGHAFLGR